MTLKPIKCVYLPNLKVKTYLKCACIIALSSIDCGFFLVVNLPKNVHERYRDFRTE